MAKLICSGSPPDVSEKIAVCKCIYFHVLFLFLNDGVLEGGISHKFKIPFVFSLFFRFFESSCIFSLSFFFIFLVKPLVFRWFQRF